MDSFLPVIRRAKIAFGSNRFFLNNRLIVTKMENVRRMQSIERWNSSHGLIQSCLNTPMARVVRMRTISSNSPAYIESFMVSGLRYVEREGNVGEEVRMMLVKAATKKLAVMIEKELRGKEILLIPPHVYAKSSYHCVPLVMAVLKWGSVAVSVYLISKKMGVLCELALNAKKGWVAAGRPTLVSVIPFFKSSGPPLITIWSPSAH